MPDIHNVSTLFACQFSYKSILVQTYMYDHKILLYKIHSAEIKEPISSPLKIFQYLWAIGYEENKYVPRL